MKKKDANEDFFKPITIKSTTPRLERPADVPELSDGEHVEDEASALDKKRVNLLNKIGLSDASVCAQAITYKIGKIDERFNLTSEDASRIIFEAETAWESNFGYNFFDKQDEKGILTINFVYDQRQKMAQDSLIIREESSDLEEKLTELREESSDLRSEYDESIKDYRKKQEKLIEKYDDLKELVDNWNEGGYKDGSLEELKAIEEYQDELLEEKEDLEDYWDAIEKIADKIKKLAKEEEALIAQYNEDVLTYQEKYKESQDEFQKGLYKGSEGAIEVYQFFDKDDLRLLLVHEMGHALGLEHVKNKKSVMYPILGEQQLYPLEFSQEDTQAIEELCHEGASL